MGDVDSWYCRVVDVRSWMFDEGSWRRSSRGCSRLSRRRQLDDRYGTLRSVVSLTVTIALPRQSCADGRDGGYGCAAPKLCGRFGDGSYGFVAPKLCGRIGTVAKALRCQSSALSSEQARRPRLRLALS